MVACQAMLNQHIKTGLVSFDQGVDVQFQIGNHRQGAYKPIAWFLWLKFINPWSSPAFINKKLTKIQSSANSDLASLNNGIEEASKLFTTENGLLVIFSDFFSTDMNYPDSVVANLLHDGIRTLAVGVGKNVMHSHWFTAGMMQGFG